MRAPLLAVLACCVSLAALAQTNRPAPNSRSLTLRACLDLALSRNLDLQIEHLNTDVARYYLSGAYGVYVPTLSFRAQRDSIDQPGDFDPKKLGFDLPYEMRSDTLEPGLKGNLPIGLTYGVDAYTRQDTARTDLSSDLNALKLFPGGIRTTNNYFSEIRFTVQQHLLRDFWIDSDREQILLRRKDLQISQQVLRFQIMKIVLAVELSYYDLLAARENVRVQENALQLRQQLVNETRRRVEVGDLPPLDAEQAETQLENTRTALTAAQETLTAQQNLLKSLLTDNFQEWVDVELEPADALLVLPEKINRSESFQRAMSNRPDLIEARLAVEKRDVVVRFWKNQLFPNLDLVGNYGGLGVAENASASIHSAVSFTNQEYSYGVILSFPLSNVGERGNYHASQGSRRIAKLQLQKAEQDVLVQISDFVNRAQSRFSQVGSTRRARVYAEAALAAEQKKLQNGLSTAFFVLQLQETLIAARTGEFQAMADYNKTLAQLAFSEGSILEKNHLSLEVK